MKALTVRQPWAWLLVNGVKDVENRSWITKHRGPLLVHAAKSVPSESFIREIEKDYRVKVCRAALKYGGIIGQVEVVECYDKHPSKWFIEGEIGWEVCNPKTLPFAPCVGKLGFFYPQTLDQPRQNPPVNVSVVLQAQLF